MLDGKHNERLAFGPTMNRASLAVFLSGAALFIAIPACKDEGVGDPCTPEQEYNPSFIGFDEKEVNVESKSFQCRTRICLVNHFRGRASCPYGQSIDGNPPAGAKSRCVIPGTTDPVTGLTDPGDPNSFVDSRKKSLVPPTRPSTARAAAPTSTATSRATRCSAPARTASPAPRSSRRSARATKA
jgi:hypothetical protein